MQILFTQMNNKIKIYWLTVFIFVLLSSCMDKVDNRNLKIYNKSDNTIYFFISKSDLFSNYGRDYSEEVLETNNCVKQDTFAYIIDRPIFWNEYIKNCLGGKMRLFIVAKDSIDKYGLKTVISKSIYTQKYLLDINDLKKANWNIIYKIKSCESMGETDQNSKNNCRIGHYWSE